MAYKKLAIDASIWLFQFMRAMRDEQTGDMVRNAHLKGFFSRICRLLYHKVRPVFVFDGAAPGLKRATLAARRLRRDVQSSNVKKVAEKLLLNNLKKHVLEAAKKADQGSSSFSRPSGPDHGPSASSVMHLQSDVLQGSRKRSFQEVADEELARQMQEEEDRLHGRSRGGGGGGERGRGGAASSSFHPGGPSTSSDPRHAMRSMGGGEIDKDLSPEDALAIAAAVEEEEEDWEQEGDLEGFSAAELALMDARNRGLTLQGERAAVERAERGQARLREQREPQNALVPASKALSRGRQAAERSDEEEEEEEGEGGGDQLSLLPSNIDELDPEVLSTLPQSVQLEILERMRDARAAANRDKFQEASNAKPENFSSLQLANYLKASQFKQKMESYKLQIGGGVQKGDETIGRRLASDSTREFVFRKDGEAARPSLGSGGFLRPLPNEQSKEKGKDKAKIIRGLSKANAAALANPILPLTLAPLATKVPLASFKGMYKEEDDAQKATVDEVDEEREGGYQRNGLLSISIEIKEDEDLKMDDLFKSDNEEEEEEEWVDVDPIFESTAGAQKDSFSKEVARKEAMIERQKVWSTAHGFKFGRKLGDWRKDEEGEGLPSTAPMDKRSGERRRRRMFDLRLRPASKTMARSRSEMRMPTTTMMGNGRMSMIKQPHMELSKPAFVPNLGFSPHSRVSRCRQLLLILSSLRRGIGHLSPRLRRRTLKRGPFKLRNI